MINPRKKKFIQKSKYVHSISSALAVNYIFIVISSTLLKIKM